jgi:phasin family protein
MSDINFDPNTILETYRNALAPVTKAQQESFKTFERLGRYHYAVVGDYLNWTLAQTKAAVAAQTPAEFVSKQIELATALGERLRARAQEFVTLATEAQTSFTQGVSEATAKVAEVTKKAA